MGGTKPFCAFLISFIIVGEFLKFRILASMVICFECSIFESFVRLKEKLHLFETAAHIESFSELNSLISNTFLKIKPF